MPDSKQKVSLTKTSRIKNILSETRKIWHTVTTWFKKEAEEGKLTKTVRGILLIICVLIIFSVLYTIDEICGLNWCPQLKLTWLPCDKCLSYFTLGFTIIGVVLVHVLTQKKITHKERLVDYSEVKAMFVEADTLVYYKDYWESEELFNKKKEQLEKEFGRLKKITKTQWTEFQVLSIQQMLLEFLKKDELKSRARYNLDILEDYAIGKVYSYEEKQYDLWRDRIEEAIEDLEKKHKKRKNDPEKCSKLKAELTTLLEHIADYQKLWSEGAVIIRSLRTCCVVSVPILFLMALLPLIPALNMNSPLTYHNWGFLGILGAVTAILIDIRKTDYVEIGNTEGKIVLQRSILGTSLGMIAGIILYAAIAGELVKGDLFPELNKMQQLVSGKDNFSNREYLKNLGKSISWAFIAGFSFRRLFQRIEGAVDGNV